jgi:hypothetical protein
MISHSMLILTKTFLQFKESNLVAGLVCLALQSTNTSNLKLRRLDFKEKKILRGKIK